ncbi:uncharacterized protein GGS25DRAFT_492138 [Hypoxylon fragiforme]|uniref:uncharacterized protein n=1 Tax=Hypoxylon fragiforme TaxID=63214 RepID=UPI0020C633F7|nr:uncharacterized protein GGS25DRAFT_492138 [Hypoxylon fragiforme]KAI2608919.1 hypothetical protein GGS25DRAFT_492138 [Hypoxylon fragiforme]
MSPAVHPLSPTSSLPPLHSLTTLNKEQVFSSLDNLNDLYCPVSLTRAIKSQLQVKKSPPDVPAQQVDSGYVSEDEDESEVDPESTVAAMRADVFERNHAIRWLTTLIARTDELLLLSDEEREHAVDKASYVLASFSKAADEDEEEDTGITRSFSFELHLPAKEEEKVPINVLLHDGPHATKDHTDVGLQSWGASIVFSDLLCASPARFGFARASLGSSPRIIELGAGTGLASLALAKVLSHLDVGAEARLIATDYHPMVLANLRSNIRLNQAKVETCALDWSAPVFAAPLDAPADVLVATDVIYAPEHAVWLRACATRLLAREGVFWLLMTVRPNGRFEEVVDSVESGFQGTEPKTPEGRYLTILGQEFVEKRRGVGRGDESGYKLFRIGWALDE